MVNLQIEFLTGHSIILKDTAMSLTNKEANFHLLLVIPIVSKTAHKISHLARLPKDSTANTI